MSQFPQKNPEAGESRADIWREKVAVVHVSYGSIFVFLTFLHFVNTGLDDIVSILTFLCVRGSVYKTRALWS